MLELLSSWSFESCLLSLVVLVQKKVIKKKVGGVEPAIAEVPTKLLPAYGLSGTLRGDWGDGRVDASRFF